MRDIHIAHLDKPRPVLALTREPVRAAMRRVTGTIKGLSTEVPVGPRNGLDSASVVSCDNITTIEKSALGRHLRYLLPDQEPDLTAAIHSAFALLA